MKGAIIMVLLQSRNIFKKINDEVTEEIFDMRNVKFLKEIEKKWGFVTASIS